MFSNNGKLTIKPGKSTPMLFISPETQGVLDTIVNRTDEFSGQEVGWLGVVERNENDFILEKVYVPEQEVHATTTEITPEGLDKLANQLMEEGKSDEINKLKLWGHSHVNMSVSPSGQDDSQLRDFMGDGEYFIRMILNKRGSYKVDIYFKEGDLVFENVSMVVLNARDREREEQIKKDILSNVKKKTYFNKYKGSTWSPKAKQTTMGKGSESELTFENKKEHQNNVYTDLVIQFTQDLFENEDDLVLFIQNEHNIEEQLELLVHYVSDYSYLWDCLYEMRSMLAMKEVEIKPAHITQYSTMLPEKVLRKYGEMTEPDKKTFIKELSSYQFNPVERTIVQLSFDNAYDDLVKTTQSKAKEGIKTEDDILNIDWDLYPDIVVQAVNKLGKDKDAIKALQDPKSTIYDQLEVVAHYIEHPRHIWIAFEKAKGQFELHNKVPTLLDVTKGNVFLPPTVLKEYIKMNKLDKRLFIKYLNENRHILDDIQWFIEVFDEEAKKITDK